MANKYCNIIGSNPVKDEYSKINTGFDTVEADIEVVNAELTADEAALQVHKDSTTAHNADNVVFTPGTSGLASTKTSDAIKEVNSRVTTIITTPVSGAAATQEIVDARTSTVKGTTFASLDARLEAAETDMAPTSVSTPTDYTAVIIPIPNTAFVGKLALIAKGRTSDTTTITTDFNNISTGGNGDTLNAVMKLYKGSVDPASLPTPTDPLWTQVTDVSKLKTQNETPLTSTNTAGRTAVYNGKTLVVQSSSQPAVRDDFAGKVAGSTTVCPNIGKYAQFASTLLAPNGAWDAEFSQSHYNVTNAVDGATFSLASQVSNGKYGQQLFSFDLIRITEDKYGTIPSADQSVAGKVAWLKANISNITPKWTGYGSCSTGNKAYLKAYRTSWDDIGLSNTANSPALLSTPLFFSSGYWASSVQSDGFIHFLAYTDASDGVTASTIYTDYINIELQFKPVVGYDLLVDQNPRRDSGMADMVNLQKVFVPITDDFTGKVSGDTVVCANVAKRTVSASTLTNLVTPSTVDGNLTEFNAGNYTNLSGLDSALISNSTTVNLAQSQQLFSFNLIRMFKDSVGYDIPIDYTGVPATDLANQVQWLKDNLLNIVASAYIFGSCPAGNKAYLDAWTSNFSGTWTYKYQGLQNNVSNSASSPTLTTITTASVTDKIDSNGMVHFLAYTDASNGTIASTINTDYIKLDLTFKNPNNAMLMFTKDSVELENLTSGKSEALLVELDLSTICTNLFGGDNAKLKSALKSIQVDAWAMGSGALNGALGYSSMVNVYTNSWSGTSLTNSTPSIAQKTGVATTGAPSMVQTTNKVYYLFYAPYTSDGIIPSQVSLDYIKTTVALTRVLSESAYKVRSVGKNLFDKSKAKDGYTVNTSDGTQMILANYSISGYMPVKAGLSYTKNIGTTLCAYYSNKNFISSGTIPFTLPAGTGYIRTGMLTTDKDALQIELGSVATTYEPYKETVAYTPPTELRSVGSVTDTFDANSGLLTTRIAQKVLQASDVTAMGTTYTNLDYALTNAFTDNKAWSDALTGFIILDGYDSVAWSGFDNVSNIGKSAARTDNKVAIGFAKGTTLAQAQTALTGKKLTYVLATPTTTQYDAQIIDAYPSGTVYCEPNIRDTFKYTTKVNIANTLYPIKALTKLYKVTGNAGEEVVMTPIDVSTCTVAGDGLSFTSTALTAGDYVEYEYEYEAWRVLLPTINISYPNNLRGVVDGLVSQTAKLEIKTENLEHFTVAMLLNHEARLTAHSI